MSSTQINKSVPICLPVSLTTINYAPKILSGLGKPTRRGIKKCSKCGYYNGTRSSICKNKQCGVFLKDSEEKNKELEAVKLITGTVRQVYSVKVRDVGPDYRGFVQLPFFNSHTEEDANILSEVALCFVDSCQRLFDDNILKCHEEEQIETSSLCVHLKAALKSCSIAKSVDFKNEVLQSLQVTKECKEKLYLLATETEGPLVQRVSKSVMAVKCQVTPKHPLGYLHFTFARGKGKDVFEKCYCSCTETINLGQKLNNTRHKCIHYYACVCALASDNQLLEEFFQFISTAFPTNKDFLANSVNKLNITRKCIETEPNLFIVPIKRKSIMPLKKAREKKSSKKTYQLSSSKKCKVIIPKIFPVEIKVLSECPEANELVNSSQDNFWQFLDWLSFLTESINKTMRFENSGIINTLIFHIPENFYGCLKKRIPNFYCSDQRATSDAAAFYILNILHLKEIFDTPKVKLRISKKFVHSEQNGYVEYDENDEHNYNSYKSTFIFFLNVGQSTVDESDNTNNSFLIEWLPNISSLMKIGQLKLQYKYGRKST